MKAFVLCAGLGTRLRPLTDELPKPAVPLLGRSLIHWTLAHLAPQGVDGVVINTHHLPDRMEAAARDAAQALKLPFAVSHEPVIQGTGGALRDARSLLPTDEPFVMWNGDILAEVDLADARRAHVASGALATMVLRPMPPGEKYGAVEIDGYRNVRRIAGKGPGGDGLTSWHFSGIHIIDPALIDSIAPTGEVCINKDVYLSVIAAGGRIHGHLAPHGYWSDLGTPARYLATQAELLHGALDLNRFPSINPLWPPSRSGTWLNFGAKVDKGVAVIPPVWIGPKGVVEKGARLGPNAAINGIVRAGAEVMDSAVLGGEVTAGESLLASIRLAGTTTR